MARVTIQGRKAREAERKKVKASIGIDGTTGTGKSTLALYIGWILAGRQWDKVSASDTENKSLDLLVGQRLHDGTVIGKFLKADIFQEDGYSPFNYEYLKNQARKRGDLVHIMDSYSHGWTRQGGVLDAVDTAKKANPKANQYTIWGLPDIKDAKNLIFELVRDSEMHMISTLRVKEKHAMEMDERGKNRVVSLGEQQQQQEGLKYEFDLLLSVEQPGNVETGEGTIVYVDKSRYPLFPKGATMEITQQLIDALREYLEEGADPDDLEEQLRLELTDSLKERALKNNVLIAIFKDAFPNKKIAELTLKEARALNKKFVEIEVA